MQGGGTMPIEIVGRDEEVASVRTFVEGAAEQPTALVLEGEPGIGKSTLWLAAVTAAREHGVLVLAARPAEAERSLAFAALADLFENVSEDVLARLSAPRRRALEAVLLVEDTPPDAVDPRALGVAVRDVLQVLAERRQLAVAIDDLQWLDAASAAALAFALRRLEASPVLLLLARRSTADRQPTELEQALPEESVRRLPLGPLTVGALHTLLRARLDRVFARQTLLRIHEHSGGNPFFTLELARALPPEVDPTQPLPVPQTLEELVRARLAGLSEKAREALALAAALGAPSESLLARAGVDSHALDAAVQAHIVEREDGVLRFTHPLLSSVLYSDLGDAQRDVHRRIAEVVDDPIVRARHLALATESADAAVAAKLDEAAQAAAERGAASVAAELAEHALRLTPSEKLDERHRRALAAARAHRAAGEWTRAKRFAGDLLTEVESRPLRADVLLLLAEFEGLERAEVLLEEALDAAAEQPALLATVQCRLAWTTRFKKGFPGALEHARASLELADEVDDDVLRVDALEMLVLLGSAAGDPEMPAHARRAYEIATAAGDVELLHKARTGVFMLDDVDGARALLELDYRESRERDELQSAHTLGHLASVELDAGRWELAAEYAARAHEIEVQYGFEVPWFLVPIAVVAAHRGQLELARTTSERGLKLAEELVGRHTPVHLATMGLVAFQTGDSHSAADWFGKAEATTTRLGWGEARNRWWVPDHVEALLELGRVEEANRILDAWAAGPNLLDRERVGAQIRRCRGLVAAARGDVAAAATLLEQAVAEHEAAGASLGRARALLALGVVRRRQRRKRAARDAIGVALAGFERLGAATWAERARAELGRIGGRTREEGLTAAERRVAALVAEGRTNREVAAALFLGVRTVETHLSHVYAKLGVRSRAELARTYRVEEQSSGDLATSS